MLKTPPAFASCPAPEGLPSVGYEYRTCIFGRGVSRAEARRLLTDQAEYGRWELARSMLYMGGRRRVWIRRRIQRVERTL